MNSLASSTGDVACTPRISPRALAMPVVLSVSPPSMRTSVWLTLPRASISATAWKSLSVDRMTPTLAAFIRAASSSNATVLSSNDCRSAMSRFFAFSSRTAPSISPLP